MKKKSEQIRETIGHLIYEQQVYQNQGGNDDQHDILQAKIDGLRSKLKLVVASELPCDNGDQDQG